jgi:hypothetical protein
MVVAKSVGRAHTSIHQPDDPQKYKTPTCMFGFIFGKIREIEVGK